MFNNPYLNGFNGFKEQQTQQPIQNIINTQMPLNNVFMARFLKEGETPQESFVNSKTALISLSEKKLHIKELDGTIVTYDIILPLDEKDKKIVQLESEIKELKEMMNNVATTVTNKANNEITKPITDITKPNRE